jgi:thiol-disulfide isomerase/thioredoxin
MKKKSFPVASILILAGILFLITGCKTETNKTEYLSKVLSNIEEVRSASYLSKMSGTAPGDTTKFKTTEWLKKEYVNPADTAIGSGYIWFYPDDTSKVYLYYDGAASAHFNYDNMSVTIDSFNTNKLPFRPVSSPFFNHAKNIIKYAIETKDSITLSLEEYGDSARIIVYNPSKVVYFFGRPVVTPNPYLAEGDAFVRYDIWVNTKSMLPYRIMTRMPHTSYIETCSSLELNMIKTEDLIAADFIPDNFEIMVRGSRQPVKVDLTGKAAPDWSLKDSGNRTVGLKDMKSSVLLVEFTGIGCAPCHSALPFLKQLVKDFKDKDFGFVSIETWSSDIDALGKYQKENDLNYTFLKASEGLTKKYEISGVPSFFILDRNRIIRKVVVGYEKGTTDKELTNKINELL